jgi:hypothetical protein
VITYLLNEVVEWKRPLIPVDQRLHLHLALQLELWPDEHHPGRAGVALRP